MDAHLSARPAFESGETVQGGIVTDRVLKVHHPDIDDPVELWHLRRYGTPSFTDGKIDLLLAYLIVWQGKRRAQIAAEQPLDEDRYKMDLGKIIQEAITRLDDYPGAQKGICLQHNHEAYDAMHLLLHQVADSVPDSKGDPNLPAAGGRLWYELLQESRGRGRIAVLADTRMKLTHWLRSHYAHVRPATEDSVTKRFDLALSFPGEHRAFVKEVAEALALSLTKERVFYDRFHEAELARPNLDTYLQRIYHDESELVVVFLCQKYDEKEWCGLEFRAIRDLIKKRRDGEIMFVRVADGDVKGVFEIDGYVDAKDRPASEIAQVIRDRLALIQPRNP